MSEQKVETKPKKEKNWLNIFVIILLILGLLAGISVFAVPYILKKALPYNYNEIETKPEVLGFETVKDEKIVNIALFGLDTRSPESFSGRADTIMILSVNSKTGNIKLISVMRDSLVPIPKESGMSYNKINSAYASGGPELAIKTLNTMFDLDISEYVAINFFKLADVIDLIGGIEVTLTESEVPMVNNGVGEIYYNLGIPKPEMEPVKAGLQHLNGPQAVSYARIRYTANAEGTNNDYGRTDRQRLVMEQMLKKVLAMGKSQYLKLVKPILSSCESSLTYKEVVDVVIQVLGDSPKFAETRIPDYSYLMPSPSAGVGSVVYYDINFAAHLVHAFIYDDISPEKYIEENGVSKNNWYVNGFEPPEIEHKEKEN